MTTVSTRSIPPSTPRMVVDHTRTVGVGHRPSHRLSVIFPSSCATWEWRSEVVQNLASRCSAMLYLYRPAEQGLRGWFVDKPSSTQGWY